MPHRFRQKPSSRRQAAPTAKWLVLGMTEARLVVHGQRTTHLTPVKPSHHRKRYLPQQRLAVKSYVGGVTECHVVVTDAQRIQLGHVDYGLVRELGYHRVDAFRIAWVEDHDQAWLEGIDAFIDSVADGMLDRFDRRHAHREMWVIRFALDRTLPDRYMAQNSEEGYTESAARGLKDEPPALHDHEWKQHVEANRDLTHEQWLALGRLDNIAARAQARAERGRNMRRRAA
jgi:hypothetical protein